MNAKTVYRKYIIKNIPVTLVITFYILLSLCSIVSAEEKKIATTGPSLLQEICAENNISSNMKDIEKSAETDKGATSFAGIKKAAEKKGFVAQGLKTDVGKLKELTQKGCVLVVLSKNRTYVRVKDASEWTVTLHNPSRYPKSSNMPISVFKKQWDGKALFIQTKKQANEAPLNGVVSAVSSKEGSVIEPLAGGREEATLVSLSGAEMQATAGGAPCANPPCDTDGLPPGSDGKTGDPVIIGNGDLCSEETDFLIETRGLIPLEISRTYNAQVVSNIDGWVPDIAAGPWSVRDGVYNGYGDRVFTTHTWEDLTLTADIKTVKAGTEQWETAWLNFRYQDEENKYYFLIKKDGTLEFTKKQNGVATQQQKASSYNPLDWNTVKIIANGNNIKIYVNNNLEFNYTDPSPLYVNGSIAAEARFCYAQFDNVRIQSGTDDYLYDFNTPDREEPFGRGWSFNYGIHIQKFQNGDVRFVREDGRSLIFRINPDGTYTPVTWVHDTLTKDDTGFTFRKKDGTIYRFNLDGVLQHLEDRFGNRMTLTHETIYGASRLKYVIDPTSRQFTFEYWPDGRVREIKDPTGIYKYQYIYNGIHLVQVIDPRGNSKHYEYDPVMNLRSAYIDREGNRYEYNYTYNARIETQKDPELNVTTFEYWWDTTHIVNKDNETWYYTFYPMCSGLWGIANNLGSEQTFYWDGDYNLTQLDEEYGKITKHEYDDKGNVTKIIDPENGATYPTILQYDPDYSLVTYTKDPKGNEVNYIYDNGKLTEIHEPLGKTTVMTYYPYGKIKTLTDAEGNLTEFEYDTWGYPKKIKRHTETLVIEKNFAHSIVGNLLSETDEEGNTISYTYNENNNLKEVKDGSGNIIASNTYDKNDRVKTMIDALGHTVTYEHDWAGNVIKLTEYDENNIEHMIEYTYDNKNYLHLSQSDLIRIKDQENNITNIAYTKEIAGDGYRKLIIATDAENRVTKKQFDKLGRPAYLQDPATKKTNYTFDYLGRLKTITYPDGTSEDYTYDRTSNLATKRDRKWQTISYQYDALSRLEHKIYPDSTKIDYTYDRVNNLKTVVSPTGNVIMDYDKINHLKMATYPDSKVVSYEYYNNDLREKLIYPDGSYITYHYDSLLRPIDIKDSSGNIIAHYDYDGLSSRRHALTYVNGASINYEYNALNRIKSLKNKFPNDTVFSQFDYTYDKVGNRKTITTNEGLHTYTYDKTYQLIDVTYPDMRTAHYEYDVMGNREYADELGEHWDYTLKTNGLNQYASVAKTKHNIDVSGTIRGDNPTVTVNNVNSKISGEEFLTEDVTLNSGSNVVMAAATDPSGTLSDYINLTLDTSAQKTLAYDNNGSLTGVSWRTKQTTYAYDYENRLKSLTQTGSSNATYKYDYLGRRIEKNIDGVIIKYIYDGDNIIAEYDGSGNLTAKYIYGPSIDEPIKLERSANICYYHFDGLGSVTDLSNTSGQHIEHYTYSSFGKTKIYDPATGLKRDDSIVSNFYRFTTRQWDEEAQLYFYRARYYDPNLGCFLQADPVGYDADINLYRYCSNNPVNLVDPQGLESKPPRDGKRPDETWDDYWKRKRAERDQKLNEQRAKRAKELAEKGMYDAAARALGYRGPLLGSLLGALALSQADGPVLPFGDLLALAALYAVINEARTTHGYDEKDLRTETREPWVPPYISRDPGKDPNFKPPMDWRFWAWAAMQLVRMIFGK